MIAKSLTHPIVPDDQIVWINGFPAPPAPARRPVHAVASVLKLVRNKEDTRQVFETVQALAGDHGHRLFRRFTDTAYGRRVVSEPVRLERILSDRDWLRSLPDGSLGAAYLKFMEGENLTPEGLLSSAAEAGVDFTGETQFEEYRRLFLHLAVLHDVWHVLTGYGRDALGELCNLAFSRQQTGNPGFRLIVAIGLAAQKLEAPALPLKKAVDEATRMGRGVDFILQHDIERLMERPIAEVRASLGFIEPSIYRSIPEAVKRNLLRPQNARTQAEQEAATVAA